MGPHMFGLSCSCTCFWTLSRVSCIVSPVLWVVKLWAVLVSADGPTPVTKFGLSKSRLVFGGCTANCLTRTWICSRQLHSYMSEVHIAQVFFRQHLDRLSVVGEDSFGYLWHTSSISLLSRSLEVDLVKWLQPTWTWLQTLTLPA
jgi:hypothetical protein